MMPDAVRVPTSADLADDLKAYFEADAPYLFAPYEYRFGENPGDGSRGPPVADPLMLYVAIPAAGEYSDDPPIWAISITDIMEYMIDCSVSGGSTVVTPDMAQCVADTRDALRRLADKLDAAIPIVEAA
jgi:hypothetical protein